ncbi:MAG TPA: hypothetical protein VLJ19_21530 [Variovorax sp.]|nr:hypothetical protein [Variovorax sp.]
MDKKPYARALEWLRLVSVTGVGQSLVQGLALISGFLIIQLISPQQYALYTLAYATLGTIGTLADGGIGAGVMAHGARDWRNAQGLGGVLAAGMKLRRLFAGISLAVALPVLVYLLHRNQADAWTVALIVLALLPALYAALTEDLLEIPLKLHQDITSLQRNQVLTNLLRVFAVIGSLLLLPLAMVAILANGLPRIWGNFRLRRIVSSYADPAARPDPVARKEILGMVRQTFPGALYYAVSGQITVWLVSIFGSTLALAQVGALGRFSAVLSVFGAMFSTLALPRFARLPSDAGILMSRFLLILSAVLLLSVLFPLIAYFFPAQVLLALGKDYAGLDYELFLCVVGGCVSMVVGVLYGLSVARGWVVPFAFSISSSIAVQVLLVVMLDLSTSANVMLYSLFNAVWGFVMYLGYFLYRMLKVGKDAGA